MAKKKVQQLSFKVHTPNLLKEIADCAIDQNAGVMFVPLNQFRCLLGQVAERASQLNDPKLNKLMCDLTLYEIADPTSKEYNKKALEKVYQEDRLWEMTKEGR